ncbi:NAD(P)H-dependent glycerol-3-phosphate dehydrogenase [Xanthobacter sp. TB0139]|uniref:NAD(P)H-dependent glycerol-3-phosphate dehydrogenase n=1 Tax=Xanthobacter sp. TB0139 TaxID=3459178 RepID=UPI00403A2137
MTRFNTPEPAHTRILLSEAGPPRPPRSPAFDNIAVMGGGAWGTALATVAAKAGRQVRLWLRDAETAAQIARHRRNPRYLGDTPLPENITPTTDLIAALRGAQAVLLVTPSTTVREMAGRIHALTTPKTPIFVCAKGIEAGSGLMMSEVVAEAAPGHIIGVVTGPTFAQETAAGLPTAVTIACNSPEQTPPASRAAARMAVALTTDSFRPYVSDDMAGVEVGGAVKNVIAIACGMLAGAGLGENMRAALITRGLDEMKELAARLGGRRETVTGLSGMGDLMLTCSSTKSRNFRYGHERGQGLREDQVFGGKPVLVEGRHNAVTVTDLARQLGLDMPICEMVRTIVTGESAISEAFAAYWGAPLEGELRALEIEIPHPAVAAVARRFDEVMP